MRCLLILLCFEINQISYLILYNHFSVIIIYIFPFSFFFFFFFFGKQGAEVESTLQVSSSELCIPKHSACHNDLEPYSELMKWLKEVDQAVFLELCQVSRGCCVYFLHTTGSSAKLLTSA